VTQTVGIVGLGIMGGPMAANLLGAGHTVIGYDSQPAALERLGAVGGKAADSVAALTTAADVVITMLPDSPHVEEVVLGPGGVLENAEPGLLLIDMSTIRPDSSVKVAQEAAARGVRVLDAPVSGGEAGAKEGSLSIMVGGEAEDVEAARPYLDVVGGTVVHVGPASAGQTVKAANQLIVAGNIQLLAEALVFLEAHGVDTESATAVLGGGLAGSAVLNRKAAGMRAREFAPGFRIDLHHKDLGIVTAAAREAAGEPDEREPDRPADLLAGVDQRRGHAGVGARNAARRRVHRRREDQAQAEAHHEQAGEHLEGVAGIDADAGEHDHRDGAQQHARRDQRARAEAREQAGLADRAGGHDQSDHRQEGHARDERREAEGLLHVVGEEQEDPEDPGADDGRDSRRRPRAQSPCWRANTTTRIRFSVLTSTAITR